MTVKMGFGVERYMEQHFVSIPLHMDTEFFKFRYYVNPSAEYVFLKRIQSHPSLDYYHLEFTDDDSNFIDFVPLFHKPKSNEMVRVTQGLLGLKKKRLSEYFSDCPELVEDIQNKKIKDVLSLYESYVYWCY